MVTPKKILNLNYIGEIKKNTLTVHDLQTNAEYLKDGNPDKKKIQAKFETKIKDIIDDRIATLSKNFYPTYSTEEKLLKTKIVEIESKIKALKSGLSKKTEAQSSDIDVLEEEKNTIEQSEAYKILKAKEVKNASEKKKILSQIRDELNNFISQSNLEMDSNNLKAIEKKITEINVFLAKDKFEVEKNDEIRQIIDFRSHMPSTQDKNETYINDALQEETKKRNDLANIKAILILNLRDKIYNAFVHQKDGVHTLQQDKLKTLIDEFELITKDNKSKIHLEDLKTLRSFNADNDGDYSCYKFISQEIDLASLADGMIKIYYDANDLIKQYRALLNKFDKDGINDTQKDIIERQLKDKLNELKAFNEKYEIGFNAHLLDEKNIDAFDKQAKNFLQAIDNKFRIDIYTSKNLQNLEYLGPKPSLTQKANIFKALESVGGEYVATDDKFWKKYGYFINSELEQNKPVYQYISWFQPQDKNGELIGSKVIIRNGCEDPLYNNQKCMRLFFDEDMRSCTGKLMKNPDFKNQTIVESPYWAPESWVRTSEVNDKKIAKIFSDEKMMVFLDDKPGFAVALKKVQEEVSDPKDPVKKRVVEVLKPTLFFNERYRKVMNGDDKAQKDKILNSVAKHYKDFVFASFDPSVQNKYSNGVDMKQLIQNAEFMDFDQTKQTLSQTVKDTASEVKVKVKANVKSFADNFKNRFSDSSPITVK